MYIYIYIYMSGSLLPSVDLLLQTYFCPEGDQLHDQLVVSVHLGHCQWCGFANCKQNWQTCGPIVDFRARPSLCLSIPPPLAPCVHHGLGSCTGAWGPVGTRHAAHPADDLVWLGVSQHHDFVRKWKEFPYGCRLPRRGISFCWGPPRRGINFC